MNFSDSVGVNMHIPNDSTPYAANWPAVLALFLQSGIRHVRSSAWPPWWGDYDRIHAAHVDLANAGVRRDLLWSTNPDYSAQLVASLPSQETGAYLLEGPNELDISGDGAWVANDQAAMAVIRTAHPFHKVIAPSVTSQAAFSSLGPVACDYGNLHNYYSNRNPETTGWGGTDSFGTYGACTTSMNWARQVSGLKPILITESGYDASVIPEPVLTKYTLRTLLYHYSLGIPRTYLYQFIQSEGGSFGRFGLVDGTLTPTPAYYAVAALLRLLDGAEDAATNWLTVPVGVKALGFRSGTRYFIVLWQPVQSCDPNTFTITAPAPIAQPIPGSLKNYVVTAYTFAPSGNLVAAPAGSSLAIDDGVTIVELVL